MQQNAYWPRFAESSLRGADVGGTFTFATGNLGPVLDVYTWRGRYEYLENTEKNVQYYYCQNKTQTKTNPARSRIGRLQWILRHNWNLRSGLVENKTCALDNWQSNVISLCDVKSRINYKFTLFGNHTYKRGQKG